MLKTLITIKRKPGTTMAEFREYYETRHARLADDVLSGFFLGYKRSYLLHGDPVAFSGTFDAPSALSGEAAFDVVTEIWFADRAKMEAMFAHARKPEVAAIVAADEAKFMDRDSIRVYVTEEFGSAPGL